MNNISKKCRHAFGAAVLTLYETEGGRRGWGVPEGPGHATYCRKTLTAPSLELNLVQMAPYPLFVAEMLVKFWFSLKCN